MRARPRERTGARRLQPGGRRELERRRTGKSVSQTTSRYSTAASDRQVSLERRFRDAVSTDRLSAFHAALTKQPHLSGTPGALAVTDYLKKALADAGLDVEVLEYRAYLSFPRVIASIVAPVAAEPERHRAADRRRSGHEQSRAPARVRRVLRVRRRDRTGRVRELRPSGRLRAARGARRRRAWQAGRRAIRPRVTAPSSCHTAERPAPPGSCSTAIRPTTVSSAATHGRVVTGVRREQLQRGNAKYSWYWHGDPLTPGRRPLRRPRLRPTRSVDGADACLAFPSPCCRGAKRARFSSDSTVTRRRHRFQGGLPFTYRIGRRRVRVRLHVRMNDGLRTIRDVVARVPGARRADRSVLLGTHHDAWTFGGVDPGTGTATLLELARELGALRRSGWQPERTISLAFWDAEEFGLIGSTEYAEQRRRAAARRAPSATSTPISTRTAGSTPAAFHRCATCSSTSPGTFPTAGSVYDAWRADEWARQTAESARGAARTASRSSSNRSAAAPISSRFRIISGCRRCRSSSTRPADTATVPTTRTTTRAGSPSTSPIPDFAAARSSSRCSARVALRLGESEVLPFRFSHYAQRLDKFVDGVSTWTVDDDGRTDDGARLRAAANRPSSRIAAAGRALERRIDAGWRRAACRRRRRPAERPAGPARAAPARRKRAVRPTVVSARRSTAGTSTRCTTASHFRGLPTRFDPATPRAWPRKWNA